MATRSEPVTKPPERARPASLRDRLLVLLVAATVGLWVVTGIGFFAAARAQQRQLLDQSLGSATALLSRLVQHEVDEHGPLLSAELIRVEQDRPARDLRFQIWLRATPTSESQLIYRSEGVPETPLADVNGEGFSWNGSGAQRARTLSLWNQSHTVQVQVAESLRQRALLSMRSLMTLLIAGLILLPLSTILIWWIITRALAPLDDIATSVERRTPGDLQPVAGSERAPREVLPLLGALNSLLGRVRHALEHERRFIADAAHELRTPLAAIRVNAQVFQAARDERERQEAVAGVIAGVDRGSHVIDQLLALSRVDAAGGISLPSSVVDLLELVQDQLIEQQAFAARRGITLREQGSTTRVQGSASQLAILMRNLVDNAIRYAPGGSEVVVGCGLDAQGAAQLWVEDQGPGVPPEQRARMFERFYRVSESGQYGSGLGLSIVQRIAELHRAEVRVEDRVPGPGLCLRVRFSPSSAPAPSARP
ncbi:MAG: ATP-binding protein [Steroidobacteraceae bacterium]